MKKNSLFNIICRLFFCCTLLFTAACEDDNDVLKMGANEGEMSFSFIRINGYGITELNELSSIKITLEKDGIRKVLPSLQLNGSADSISSEGIFLTEGTYRVIEYRAFDSKAYPILECIPEKDNEFTVTRSTKSDFVMPVVVNHKVDRNNILNTLTAICLDAFGEDKSLWPKTWNKDTDLEEWENLEFEYQEDGSIAYIVGITLDKKFASMKKLSPAIVNFPTLESLIIRDNALTELPDNFGELAITCLQISNTNLSSFPESAKNLHLNTILLDGNKFTKFPEFLKTQTDMRVLQILNERIAEIPADDMVKMPLIDGLMLCGLDITSLPDVFDVLYRISTLNISNNKQLSTLPSTIKSLKYGNQASYMRGIIADGCGFTSFPQELISPKFQMISLANNKITSLNAEDIEFLPGLHTLYLSGNKLTSFPDLDMPSLGMLVLIDCGLTPAQVNRTGLPNLYSTVKDINTGEEIVVDFLFFTQEHFDSVLKGYEVKVDRFL
ncbi:MAG: hypothetical protein RR346_05310 [Bacteroidales bacterium]